MMKGWNDTHADPLRPERAHQNVLARLAQWEQHGCQSKRVKQASVEGSFRSMRVVRREQWDGFAPHPWGEPRRR